jgi:ligand-binding SRPBCC domain-containing protein
VQRWAKVPVFVKSVRIDAPVEDVFRFHEQPDALALLSAGFPPVRVISQTGTGIAAGFRVELRVAWFRWVALITKYEKNSLFVDEQLEGPFAKWIHRHEFEAVGNETVLTDRLEYELPGGWPVKLLFGWMVSLGLRNMFAHLHRMTRQLVGAASS